MTAGIWFWILYVLSWLMAQMRDTYAPGYVGAVVYVTGVSRP